VGKPSPVLLALAVAGVISVSGCADGVFRGQQDPARQVAQGTLGPKFPSAADPDYQKAYAQYREQEADRQVVAPALGIERHDDAGTIRQVGLGSEVSSVASSVSSGVRKGLAKVGKLITPEERVVKPAEPTSVFNRSEPTPELYVAVARLNEQAGKLDQAEKQYRLALKIAPDHLGALLGYAHLKDRVGHLDEAIQLYQKAAAAHPHDASVLNDMGLCYARNGRLDEAVAALNHAVQIQPKKPLYRHNIAIVLTEMGQIDAALLHLRAVEPEAVARYNLGQLLLRKGQREAAARQFALALQSDASLTQAKAWLDELARSGVTPGQSSARIASKPGATGSVRTLAPPRSAPDARAAATGQASPPSLRAPGNWPVAQARPAPESRPAKDLRSVYGNFPVPSGRLLDNRRPMPGRAPAPPVKGQNAFGAAPQRFSAPEPPDKTWPGAAGVTTPEPSPVAEPAGDAPLASPPRSVAPEPSDPGSGPSLPELTGQNPAHAVAPLPPVADPGKQVKPLPPVQSAPLPVD
jgi:tetratricopeptide (TPR) repeat protein